jgi:hypothetical protein
VLGRSEEVAVSVLVDGRAPAGPAAAAGPEAAGDGSGVTVSVLEEQDRRWV